MSEMRQIFLLGLILLLAACSQGQRESAASPSAASRQMLAGQTTPIAAIVTPAADRQGAAQQEGEAAAASDVALIEMGRALYASNCAPCHHSNGEGNLGYFPALNRNPFVRVSDPIAVIYTVLYGRGQMPAFAPTLSSLEVAAVISYIRNGWSNQAPVVTEEQVRRVREGAGTE